jgi:hypothetical protein
MMEIVGCAVQEKGLSESAVDVFRAAVLRSSACSLIPAGISGVVVDA